MKNFKALSLFVLSLVMVFTLAACSSSKTTTATDKPADPTTSATVAPVATAKPEEVAAPTAAPMDLGGRTIHITAWWDDKPKDDSEAGKKALARIAEVEKMYNVKLVWDNIPWDQFQAKFTAGELAGTPIGDIVMLGSGWAIPAVVAGQIMTVDSYTTPIEDINTDMKYMKKQPPFLGQTYMFGAVGTGGGGIAYNRDLFKKLGLPDLHTFVDAGTWTWDKFLEIAKLATKDTNNDGKIDTWGTSGWSTELGSFLIASNDGIIADVDNGKEAITNPNTIEALEFLNKLYNVDKVVKSKSGDFAAYERDVFKESTDVAMSYTWDWMYPYDKFDYGFVPFPKGPKSTDYAYPADEQNWVIPVGVKDPNLVYAVFEAIKTLDSGEEYPSQSWIEGLLKHEDDIDVLVKQVNGKSKMQLQNAFDKFPYGDVVADILVKKQSVSTTVQKYKQQAQDAMDKVLKK
jgi:multiple sugar transport system substrate-binding protein